MSRRVSGWVGGLLVADKAEVSLAVPSTGEWWAGSYVVMDLSQVSVVMLLGFEVSLYAIMLSSPRYPIGIRARRLPLPVTKACALGGLEFDRVKSVNASSCDATHQVAETKRVVCARGGASILHRDGPWIASQ